MSKALTVWWRRRMTIKELRKLTDDELLDIGVLRSEIEDYVNGCVYE